MRIDEIIYKTLIAGDSYRTLLKGLWVTFQISLLSLLLGTLLGVAVCAMRRSRLRLVRSIAAVYMAVVRGSPVLLLLMLMYYVVFAGSNVSPVMVAVAAFSLHMSAYTAACFYSAINATDAMPGRSGEDSRIFQMAGVYPDYTAADSKNREGNLPVHHRYPDPMDQCCGLCYHHRSDESHKQYW